MSCTPTNRHALAKRRNPRPVCAPTRLRISPHSHTTHRARGFLEREREGRTGPVAEHDAPQRRRAVDADDKADEVGRHHEEDVEDAAERGEVAVPGAGAELRGRRRGRGGEGKEWGREGGQPSVKAGDRDRESVMRESAGKGGDRGEARGKEQEDQDSTLPYGTTLLAAISGSTKRTTPHPQTRSLRRRSCHSATKVKTPSMETTGREAPPSGM